jgi:hypothetical protein
MTSSNSCRRLLFLSLSLSPCLCSLTALTHDHSCRLRRGGGRACTREKPCGSC